MDECPAGFGVRLTVVQARAIGEDENGLRVIAVDVSDNAYC